MPYLHSRITPEVIGNRQVVHLHIDTGPVGEGEAASVHVLDPDEFEEVPVDG